MGLSISNEYVLKALTAYPWMGEVVESLGYALAYDDENGVAYYLLAKIQAEELGMLDEAKSNYELALVYSPDFEPAYTEYVSLLLNVSDFDRAEQIIQAGLRNSGISNYTVYFLKAMSAERRASYKVAIKWLEKTYMEAYNREAMEFVRSELKRVKSKRKAGKKRRTKKSKRKLVK